VRVLSRSEVDGPVDEIQIEVLKLKLGKSIIEGFLDLGRIVLGVPQLSSDEDVLTL
jgi:hypothetical protein